MIRGTARGTGKGKQALKRACWQGNGGGAEEDRTPDLRIANATLSQLSYRPNPRIITGLGRVGEAPVGSGET